MAQAYVNLQSNATAAFAIVQQHHLVTKEQLEREWLNAGTTPRPNLELDPAFVMSEEEFREVMVEAGIIKDKPKVMMASHKPSPTPQVALTPEDYAVSSAKVVSGATVTYESHGEVIGLNPETYMGLSEPRIVEAPVVAFEPMDEPIIWNVTDSIVEYFHILKKIPNDQLDREMDSYCYKMMMTSLKQNLWINNNVNTEFARRLRNEGFEVNYVNYLRELTVVVHPAGPFIWKV
jgi:hypothetical protein